MTTGVIDVRIVEPYVDGFQAAIAGLDLQYKGTLTNPIPEALPPAGGSVSAADTGTGTSNDLPPSVGWNYYAILNVDTGTVMRGRTNIQGDAALCPQGVLLTPNSHYREYDFNATTLRTGYSDFESGPSGTNFTMPEIVLHRNTSPDADGDGLPDMAEFIAGTNPHLRNTNGDGISDYAAVQQGLDPLAGTGLIPALSAAFPCRGRRRLSRSRDPPAAGSLLTLLPGTTAWRSSMSRSRPGRQSSASCN